MNITNKKILKTILIIALIIIIMLVSWLFLGGKSFSKYIKNINLSSTNEVAKPIFTVDGIDNILIDGIQDTVYNFSVKNFDSTGVSEIPMYYYIEIINNSEADLTFELTKDNKIVNLTNNKTNLISLLDTEKQEDVYSLKIKYENNVEITSDIAGNVQVKVESVQAKNQ